MKNLEWITWKTEESELINPQEIVEKLNALYQDYNSYMNPVVYEGIKHEKANGGLNKEAFIIDNKSPATEVANKIMSDIDEIKDMINNLIESARLDAEEQRKLELRLLIQKIEEKIEKDKRLIENSKGAQLKYQGTELSETSDSIQVVINVAKKRIELLTKKLESLSRN